VPSRAFDICATFEDFDAGDPQGFGPDEESAIADLFDAAETADWFEDRPPQSEAALDAEIARLTALRERLYRRIA
jgi:hypothetical protein